EDGIRGLYVTGVQTCALPILRARGFVLGSYLLVKGTHTFLNMNIGAEAQWFPEYAVELGRALTPPPSGIEALRVAGGLYVRRYEIGRASCRERVYIS